MWFDCRILHSYDKRLCYWTIMSSYTIVCMEDNTFIICHDENTKKAIAGPFDTLDAAKAAYALLASEKP